jgi:hypothetical protein
VEDRNSDYVFYRFTYLSYDYAHAVLFSGRACQADRVGMSMLRSSARLTSGYSP